MTPEAFARTLCLDIGLTGEAVPLIAHAIHEELMKHKKDAVEWGVIGGDQPADEPTTTTHDRPTRDRSGFGLMKDKTGLGLGWGRAPRDGRGPKNLKSVWRDWAEAEEFRTKFEVLSAEEVERREIEKERASRYAPRSSYHTEHLIPVFFLDDCEEKPRNFKARREVEEDINYISTYNYSIYFVQIQLIIVFSPHLYSEGSLVSEQLQTIVVFINIWSFYF